MRLENKVVIITGAGSGIGKETAILFAREGAKVVVADIDEIGGKETVSEINKNGQGLFVKLDVSSNEQSKSIIKDVLEKYKKIDVLINNAGITQDSFISKMTESQWDRVLNIRP